MCYDNKYWEEIIGLETIGCAIDSVLEVCANKNRAYVTVKPVFIARLPKSLSSIPPSQLKPVLLDR